MSGSITGWNTIRASSTHERARQSLRAKARQIEDVEA